MKVASSLILSALLLTGCSLSKKQTSEGESSTGKFKLSKLFYKDKTSEKVDPNLVQPTSNIDAPEGSREQAGTILYDETMAKIEAKRLAEASKLSRPISEKFDLFLFEVGPLKSKCWLYSDGRYALRQPGKLKGHWVFQENVLSLTAHSGEKWLLKKLPSGTYESPDSADTYLIPIKN